MLKLSYLLEAFTHVEISLFDHMYPIILIAACRSGNAIRASIWFFTKFYACRRPSESQRTLRGLAQGAMGILARLGSFRWC